MKWIVVADAAKARVFSANELNANWNEISEMTHPESREKISELYRDEPNVNSTSANSGKDFVEPATDLKEKEVEAFAQEVSDFLKDNHLKNAYSDLYIIAAPNFLGTLRPLLHKGVDDKIVDSLNKNITDLHVSEIKERLNQHLDS